MYRGVWRTPFWDGVQRLWRVPIQNYKILHKIKEIMWVNLWNLFQVVFVGLKRKMLFGSTFKFANLLSLRYLSFKHNGRHSWVMLPITVDFLFDGRNTRLRNKSIGICVEDKISRPRASGKRVWFIEYTRNLWFLNANKGTNQCSCDMNNYCQWHKMADVRSVENRNCDFILNARPLFFPRSWSVCGIDNSACVYLTKMCVVEIVLIHLPAETSAFFAILYYLWMFICCFTGVPLWNKPSLKSTTSRFEWNFT